MHYAAGGEGHAAIEALLAFCSSVCSLREITIANKALTEDFWSKVEDMRRYSGPLGIPALLAKYQSTNRDLCRQLQEHYQRTGRILLPQMQKLADAAINVKESIGWGAVSDNWQRRSNQLCTLLALPGILEKLLAELTPVSRVSTCIVHHQSH